MRKLKIINIIVCALLLIPLTQYQVAAETKWVKPLKIGRAVKLYLYDDQTIKGLLMDWNMDKVTLKTANGEVAVNTAGIKEAKYLLGYNESKVTHPKVDVPDQTGEGQFGNTVSNKPMPESNKVSFKEDKADWERRISTARTARILAYLAGIGGFAGGMYLYIDGENQRQNPEWVVKGIYLTNEDDVNAGNQKVMIGLIVASLGSTLVVLGIVQGNHINDLVYEGRHRGFVVSTDVKNDYCGMRFSYNY